MVMFREATDGVPTGDGEIVIDQSTLGRVNCTISKRVDGDIRATLSGIEKFEFVGRLQCSIVLRRVVATQMGLRWVTKT
jgi:hypothetical protein